jgi:perosamine synthetase
MSKLAILGGRPVLEHQLTHYNSVGREELEAVTRVMNSGCLSGFYGSWGEEFYGGPMVKAFEEAWQQRFGVKHAISVNSATSGLFAAMGAVGIGPGDEVIVPPYTMSATVVAPLIYGGIPVFADIDPDTFCLDPEAVSRVITPRTKAILAVNLFGHPARLAELREIARQHHLALVEDNAQGPLAAENGRYCGTVGHIGVFSLNYHKHIHTGEGGMCVTNDAELARRLSMIRNHAENIVEPLDIADLTNLVGFNYRLTELSAAVGLEQLKKIDLHVGRRERLAGELSRGIAGLPGLTPPVVRDTCRHVYYVWAMRFDADQVGVSREQFSQALAAEGFPHGTGYVRPLYLLPLFQQRIAIGSKGYPFNLGNPRYEKGICPVTERMHEKELLGFETCMYDVDRETLNKLTEAIHKVYRHRRELAFKK